ncbi:hypothetical protein [Micromonospora sp. NPDC005707]|uniref:hypothetical protein n=1 Tax=Micromonospora sp. NPDC005707 TaxID=3157050 RepID=UPI0033F6665B
MGEQKPARSRGWSRPFRARADDVDDRKVAGLLAYQALVEIRRLAGQPHRQREKAPPDDILERIRFLANLTHNLPLVAQPQGRRPSRPRPTSRRERAMRDRPMSWTWNTSGPSGQEWMLRHIGRAGYRWTPPPPLPTPLKGHSDWGIRQRIRLLAGWPVRTPPGRRPLPRQAQVLKALDRDGIYALYEEAGRRRLGLGSASPRLRAHLDPDALHYLFPDPAAYYWPDDDRPWWQCRVLLRMIDGEQTTGSLAVLPDTFTALPSTLPRMRQRRLALTARMLERDYYLWYRDHEANCSPQRCGYPHEPTA